MEKRPELDAYKVARDVPLPDPKRGMIWFSDPDLAYVHPNEEGVSMVAMMPSKRRLDEFRGESGADGSRALSEPPTT